LSASAGSSDPRGVDRVQRTRERSMMKPEIRHHLNAGRESYAAGDFTEAEPHLMAVLEHHDGFADVYNMLGVILHQQGLMQKARQRFERAIEINPRYTEAALNLAVCYNELGQYDEAKKVYERAAGGEASTDGAASGEGAISHLDDAFVRGKIANLHSDLGQAYYAVGMLEEAADEYRKALTLCPSFVDIQARLGMTLRDARDYDASLETLSQACESAPEYLPARVHRGLTLWCMGRHGDARADWESVLAKDPENRSCKLYMAMANEQG
jgi:tetratricopeptide (TPR) repeat protein